jgi:transposase
MAVGVKIRRTDLDAAGLRRAAARSRDGDAARRMLALALVLDGHSRTQAAELCGMDRQTLRDWVHRYNDLGLGGLSDRPPPGAKPRLSAEQQAEVARWVREGPTLSEHGVVRWRRIDLSRQIEARFGVQLAERTVGSLLRRLGFRRLSVRPRHPGHDAAAQETHKKTSPTWSPPRSPSTLAASRSSCGGRTRPGSASKGP